MNKVYIVGWDYSISDMFLRRGWKLVDNTNDADLIQFTGGEDVTPSYYDEEAHARTYCNPRRDYIEFNLFKQCVIDGKALTGICRGGQFLNVVSGGKMWQHVDHHAIGGTHPAMFFDDVVNVTSTHHQMMRPQGNYELIGTASLSSYRETASEKNVDEDFVDIESVFYPETKSLCFQPHPEYVNRDDPCQDLYFNLLEKYFGLAA